jgi:hypothetical protein
MIYRVLGRSRGSWWAWILWLSVGLASGEELVDWYEDLVPCVLGGRDVACGRAVAACGGDGLVVERPVGWLGVADEMWDFCEANEVAASISVDTVGSAHSTPPSADIRDWPRCLA